LRESSDKVKFNVKQKQVAEVNGDGNVTSTDARLILQHTAGKIDKFPTK
jgi:hypothetical protein